MKKIIFIASLLCLIILTGCTAKNSSFYDEEQDANEVTTATSPKNNLTEEVASVNNNLPEEQELKKYYPESLGSQVAQKNATTQSRMPENLQIRAYLVDKYNPGICYGMPWPIKDEDINNIITINESFAKYIKDKYKLKSDLEIYMKMKQYLAIKLIPASGGKFQYNIIDGQCCTSKLYDGTIENLAGRITENLLNQDTKNNPC